MNYDGEKFLLKLYKELYNEQSVKHSSTKSDNKYEAVKKYIERLERVHEKAINHKTDTGINVLKDFYYDKYVIKKENIPESYIEYLDKVQFDQYGIHMNESQKEEQKDLIIENQKESLNEWLDYFTSEDAKFYPTWAKYWAFQGMLTIGNYDTNKGIYNKRSKTTIAPFPELDREVLSKSIDLVIKEINKEEIDDKHLEQLVKNGNFFKLYTIQLKDKRENNFGEGTKGEWIKYEQGDNYQELYKSLQGKNTGWCTAGEETCKKQVKDGDFYVYYTYDEEGKATIPRLAIRMEGKNKIAEIRGVANDQNIEPHFEDVIAKKLENFKDAGHYKRRVKDAQMITYVYTKYESNKQLTQEDIKFIYEIDDPVWPMGWQRDPRLTEMKENKLKRTTPNLKDKELILFFNKIGSPGISYLAEGAIEDKELAMNLVRERSWFLKCVSKEIIDKEMALIAVKKSGRALEYVPEELIDKEIALEALNQNKGAIEFFPKKLINKDIALTAIESYMETIKFIPKELIDKDILFATIKQRGTALEYVPKELITKELALEAIKKESEAIKYVPKEIMDKEIALTAVQRYGLTLKYVPRELMDQDIIIAALKEDGRALEYVPKNLINKDIVLIAVKNRGFAIKYTPKELIDKEIALTAVQRYGDALEFIPKEIIDKEIAKAAIKHEFWLMTIQYIPEEIIDKEIALAALEKDARAINYIPEKLKEEITQELSQTQAISDNNDQKPKKHLIQKIYHKVRSLK